MDVTWLGHGCFRLRGRGAAVVTDPYPPAIGLKLARMDAEVVTISHAHDNHSYTQVVRDGAYEISGPGEYEVAGVSVIGVPTYHDDEKGAKHGRNTIYLIEIDDVVLTRARLELARAARQTLKTALDLMGVSAPERM